MGGIKTGVIKMKKLILFFVCICFFSSTLSCMEGKGLQEGVVQCTTNRTTLSFPLPVDCIGEIASFCRFMAVICRAGDWIYRRNFYFQGL